MALDFTKPLMMGILNITPDSFSDGGKHKELEQIIECARQMVRDGADIIDVGGESTRPGAAIVSKEEELQRVIPVIEALARSINVPISIDTYKADVAMAAVHAGASIINDIGGGMFDTDMPRVMAESGAYVILMHNRQPNMEKLQTMTVNQGDLTHYDNIVEDVIAELQQRVDLVLEAGVKPEKIVLDPGIGFSKTMDGNIELLKHLEKLHALGFPVLLGVSRKKTIGKLLGGLEVDQRLEGTLATTALAVSKGIQVIRVHDVLENYRVAKVMHALKA